MYIREFPITLTLSSLGASSGLTSGPCNGLLHSVRVRCNFPASTAVDSSLKVFRALSSGTTELALYRQLAPSSAWTEHFPRKDVRYSSGIATTIGSSELRAACPLNSRLYATFASSSGLAGSVINLVFTVI